MTNMMKNVKQQCVLILIVLLLVLPGTANAQTSSICTVTFNGADSGLVAYIENGVSFLPLRSIAELCFLDIDWNDKSKCATVTIFDESTSLYLGQNRYYKTYSRGGSGEGALGAAPLVRNGHIYLPLRFISELCEANVNWNDKSRQIEISFPVVYQNGNWAYYNGVQTVLFDQLTDNVLLSRTKDKDTHYVALRRGAPTMGTDYLWALYYDGTAERIAYEWSIGDIKVADNRCYFLAKQMGFGEKYKVHSVNLSTKMHLQLGDADFVYNAPILNKDIYVLGTSKDLPYTWQITKDGVLIMGFSQKALTDDVVTDIELARQTYGIWLLDNDGNGQMLMQSISLE